MSHRQQHKLHHQLHPSSINHSRHHRTIRQPNKHQYTIKCCLLAIILWSIFLHYEELNDLSDRTSSSIQDVFLMNFGMCTNTTRTSSSMILNEYPPTNYALPNYYRNNNRRPSIETPFILFHQRKTGGSTIRSQLQIAANTTKTKTYIPCYDGIPCQTYYTPTSTHNVKNPPLIYGGHLYYGSWLRTLDINHGKYRGGDIATFHQRISTNFTCLTIFRQPTSRIQSCWNYRFRQQNDGSELLYKIPEISKVRPLDLPEYLVSSRSQYNEGCLNEPMRIFSDIGWDERIINNLDNIGKNNVPSIPPDIANHVVQQTMDRMNQCVVGILERPQSTAKVIQYYFPWLSKHIQFDKYENTGGVPKGNLTQDTLKAMYKVSEYERLVYRYANRLLDAQLASAANAKRNR